MSPRRSTGGAEGTESMANSLLHRIRNMWQFANLCQWIYLFGKAVKIDESIDVEDVEAECLKPDSPLLAEIALSLLKNISSHRGLTHDIFDDQARKQYLTKAQDRNPFGDGENLHSFRDFDVFTKIRVLQQLTQWCMIHPEKLREKMEEQRDAEQTSWRIEPYGWDSDDRIYFVLDDNRIYRMTEAPPPPVRTKSKKRRPSRAGRRTSKRQRTDGGSVNKSDTEEIEREGDEAEAEEDGLGGATWECLAVTLDEVKEVIEGFRKTRDDNEKILRKQLETHLLPILEKEDESRKRKALQRERELLSLAKMANAKRSSRIANKVEQHKQEEKEKEDIQRQREEQSAQRREEQSRLKRERERDFRMASRGQRLKERQERRVRHEQELASLSEDSRSADNGSVRVSERKLLLEIEKNKQALRELDEETEDWVFDCICGMYGQVDDGTHSVACEKCNVWQHSRCLGITEKDADAPEFQFVCSSCSCREEEARERPRPTIKFKFNRSASPLAEKPATKGPSDEQLSEDPPSANIQSTAVSDLSRSAVHPKDHQRTTMPGAQPTPILESQVAAMPPGCAALLPEKGSLGSSMASAHANHPDQGKNNLVSSPWAAQTPIGLSREPNRQNSPQALLMTTPSFNSDTSHTSNGNLPSQAGISPLKQSPRSSFSQLSSTKLNGNATVIPPGATLSPLPQEPILTPPVKQPSSDAGRSSPVHY